MTAASLSQWPRLSLLLDELLDLDPPALAQRLAVLREQDPDLAEAAQALLGRMTSIDRDGFLQASPRLPGEALAGQTVGAYQIERELGQGGMGAVWLARRTDGRFEGQVAIKFLAAGFATRGGAARFTREGSILARLAHPHIARLLDAGLAPGNQPYLVLDCVSGVPIDQFCDDAGLDATARISLCLDVLDAVAHAHTRLILHRDIKPANILVTASGDVKLLDFGIAKLLDDQTGAGQATALTRESGGAFTLLYAAPEQVQGGDVTTATDVFALGVLLHVLLTGLHPGGTADTPMARMRQLVEVVPAPMSAALLQAQAGDAHAIKRARTLRGDLDTIVAKALKKLPSERYANAEQMAGDLRHWLHDEPILARRDARLYRLRKFIVRYRAGVAVGTLAFAGLAVGIGLALWQAAEARGQHAQAEGLIEFMLGDLRSKLQPVGRLDVLDVVGEKALAYYAMQDESRLDANSLGRRARALHLIGEIAESRGKLDDAIRRFAEAEKSTAALLARAPQDGPRIFDHAQSVYWVGFIAWRQGRYPEAEVRFRRYEALALQLRKLDPNKPAWQAELAYAHQNLGTVLLDSGRFPEARDQFLQAQAGLKALVSGQPELIVELANTLSWVSRTQDRLGQLELAIGSHRARMDMLSTRASDAKDKPTQREVAVSLSEIARLELARGDVMASRRSAQAALSMLVPLSASDPANTLWREDLAGGHARLALALSYLPDEAAAAHASASTALRITQEPVSLEPSVQRRRLNLLGTCTLLRYRTATQHEQAGALKALMDWADTAASASADSTIQPMVAQAGLLLGDHFNAEGETQAARRYWQMASRQTHDDSAWPQLAAAGYAAQASDRLGDAQRAQQLAAKLLSTEYRHPDHADFVNLHAKPRGGKA